MRKMYRVLLPLKVTLPDGRSFVQHEVFSWEFDLEHERENLASGLLELVETEKEE